MARPVSIVAVNFDSLFDIRLLVKNGGAVREETRLLRELYGLSY